MTEFQEGSHEEDYGLQMRALARALWRGIYSLDEFVELMIVSVRRGLTRAWKEGAAECGISPEELNAMEQLELEREIYRNYDRIFDYAQYIEDNSKENGGLLRKVLPRTELWTNRYDAVRTRASSLACKDKKKQWHLGATEEHCKSCETFDTRVYRYSVWEQNNALPKSPILCCHGFRCDCRLEDTEERITPGPFPKSVLCP